ncbi:gluconate 2-dehydrogenase subunit 3 family protein [Marinoscillum luteum]|uniref:Gluconate 2-dehydrogenase subunit 3 family protein n=1 Tax=Marinoscillum luteum TaxID=861051 RepID=A0ABW7NB53_9BACT
MENIKRREALKRTAWIMGGVLSVPTVAGILNGCTPKPELTWTPTFFSEDQARLVMQIAEGILPETDTPGAKSLGVPGFIEEMVSVVYDQGAREAFIKGLEQFEADCNSQMGDSFIALAPEKQTEFLQKQNSELKNWENGRPFFWTIKELTIVGYYTTEYGATEALQYQAIPVEYHGCSPLSETGNGKVWAT